MFQSSPGLMAGRYVGMKLYDWKQNPEVSILARLNGRALRWHEALRLETEPRGFNPRPA